MKRILLALAFIFSSNAYAEVPLCKQSMENVTCGSAGVVREQFALASGSSFQCRLDFTDCAGSGYVLNYWSVFAGARDSRNKDVWRAQEDVSIELLNLDGSAFDIMSIEGGGTRLMGPYIDGLVPTDLQLIIKISRAVSKKKTRAYDMLLDTAGNMVPAP